MKSMGHLTTYTVNLEVQSPLFIGSGEKITKKEYLYIPRENKVIMFNLKKMADFYQRKGFMYKYEQYLLNEKHRDIGKFFEVNHITEKDYAQFTDYTIDMAGESIQGDKPMHELYLFAKDGHGNPYIPGSSIKGALRTALLFCQIYIAEREKPEKRSERAKEWKQELDECRNGSDVKKILIKGTKKYETRCLHRLRLPDTKMEDAVNSVMRGISVSDSEIIAKEQLMLSQKIDSSVKGRAQYMPLFRECLKPGTVCQFTITIDNKMAEQTGWTMDRILSALKLFQQWQDKYFFSKFSVYERTELDKGTVFWLGGGVGFINKTVNQVSIGTKEALEYNSNLLAKLFRNGHHEKDREIGISPHMMKVAAYQGKFYPMGQCKLEVRD